MRMVNFPLKIMANKIGLPTSGATVVSGKWVKKGEPAGGIVAKKFGLYADTDMFVVEGMIHPVDPNAQDIHFELGIPSHWNGKLIQAGGGGMDGYVIPSTLPLTGQDPEKSALKQGYAVVGSDGGHIMEDYSPWGCHWTLNQETLYNFASEQLKKTKDVACVLLETIMEETPEKVYFYGGSNGGRECMKAIQNYPEDYDGAICFFPVLYWMLKILMDARISDTLEDYGEKGIIDAETQAKIKNIVLEYCDGLDGVSDGLVSDLQNASQKASEIETRLHEFLTKEQFEVLHSINEDIKLSYPLGYGDVTLPGYQIYEGAAINLHLTATPKKRETSPGAGSDEFLKYAVVGDGDYDVRHFDTDKWKDRIQELSRLLDAYDTNLDAFFKHGGKLLMVQGMADPLVCIYGTNQYYEMLIKRYGKDALSESMKYYVVPGFGHGPGGDFLLGTDMIGALDQWVEEGKAPRDMIATDLNEDTKGRTRPLCEYPSFPYYTGKGDVNKAESFLKRK